MLQAEPGAGSHKRGAVSAVLQPGRRDSAGAQFFIVVTDQPSLDGQYTVFGQVSDGIEVAQKISEAAADAQGRASSRVEIKSVTIRDARPPEPEPFTTDTVAQLAAYRAVLETSKGPITLEFWPEKAPNHVRNFLRLASLGAYDGTAFHRVVKGFMIQTGSMAHRQSPLTARQQKAIGKLQPEFSDTVHVKGVLSMARGDDPASATTSFFVVTAPTPSLDGKYTAFGQVVDGLPIVEAIEAVAVDGETPKEPVTLVRVTIEKK
jgi:peptidyl-prolyl cis-trans isomerase B (cyclophilin B)